MMKKRILCFGDSNTHGAKPSEGRYDEYERWPMVLQGMLGEGFRVIEEGLNGRTIALDDPIEGGYKSGMAYLPACLMSHNPLDLVVIMLGTNDTKQRFCLSPQAISQSLIHMIRLCRTYAVDETDAPSKILIVSPAPVLPGVVDTFLKGLFDLRSVEVSEKLASEYLRVSKLTQCGFLDAATLCSASQEDCLHLSAEAHRALAGGVRAKVFEMLG